MPCARACQPCHFVSHLFPRALGEEDRRCGDEPLGRRDGADDDPARSCPGVHPEGAGLKRDAGVEEQDGRGRHLLLGRLVVARGGRRVGAWRGGPACYRSRPAAGLVIDSLVRVTVTVVGGGGLGLEGAGGLRGRETGQKSACRLLCWKP
jgi:hypothetical protein